ncbi:MAG: hypothetical protein ACFHWX_15840 [Bacteroidota bacterium]
MLSTLSPGEIEAATNLMSGGFTMAKSSMEQILQSPIDLKKVDYSIEIQEVPKINPKTGDKLHLIKTELKGQLTGSCFLVLSEDEVDRINAACLPEELLSDKSEESEVMKLAFLKEIDNMVAAAAVTEFSNILDLELFGDVPLAYLLDKDEANEYLLNESKIHKTIIHFKAIFHGEELGISPDFIWMFSDKFVDKIKKIA